MSRRMITATALACVLSAATPTASAKSIFVDPAAGPTGGDGSSKAPYGTLTRAVEAARAAHGATTIHIAEGTLANEPALPVRLDVPRLHIRGSTRLDRDARGLATGESRSTRFQAQLLPTGPVAFLEILADDVTVSGLTLDSITPQRGTAIFFVDGWRDVDGGHAIEGFAIRDCFLTNSAFATRLASGTLEGNLMTKGLIAAQIFGGPAARPARIDFRRNRIVDQTLNGIHFLGSMGSLFPLTLPIPGGPGELEVEITGNDVSRNGSLLTNNLPQFGCGLQFFVNDFRVGDELLDARIVATVRDNSFDENQNYGVVVGETVASATTVARYDFDGRFSGNRYCGNGVNRAEFGFQFFSRSLGGTPPTSRFVRGSTFEITAHDDELELAGSFDYDNPVMNPNNPGEALGNVLTFNGIPFSGKMMSPFTPVTPCSLSDVPPGD